MPDILTTCLLSLFLYVTPLTSEPLFKAGLLTYYGTCCRGIPGELLHSAISIAVDNLVDKGIIPHRNFSAVWRDSRTSAVGLANVVDFVQDEDVDVIFGSAFSSVSVATGYLTSHWNIPQISWGSTTPVLTNKTEFTTFVRTLGPFSKIGLPVVRFFEEFNWKRVGLLYYDWAICEYAVDGIRAWLQEGGVLLVDTISYRSRAVTTVQIDAYLQQLKRTSRIIILCESTNLRRYMLRACVNGMCNGEYVFMRPMFVVSRTFEQDKLWEVGDSDDAAAKHAFRFLLYWNLSKPDTLRDPQGVRFREITIAPYYNNVFRQNLEVFDTEVIERMAGPPWNDDYGLRHNLTASIYASYLYDAMYFYGLWVNYSTEHGLDMRDGQAMVAFSNGLQFDGIAGPCLFDDNGDRIPFYWIWDFTHPEGYPRVAAIADTTTNTIKTDGWKGFQWQTEDGRPPPDTPKCGFYNELCPVVSKDNTGMIVVLSTAALCMLGSIVALAYIYRKRHIEDRIMQMIWKVDIKDIDVVKSRYAASSRNNTSRTASSRSSMSRKSENPTENTADTLVLEHTGIYKGQKVYIRSLPPIRSNLTRKDLVELKEMRELHKDNINPFMGASLDSPTPYAFFAHCPKGSLQDILENDDIQLDQVFKNSLMLDLIQGMCYLHTSKLRSHGRLKSNNCLVDNRWVLKITDFGLGRFLHTENNDTAVQQEEFKMMLWTAPELLNMTQVPTNGTQKGDVYSFGIILHEIFHRMGPFAGNSDITVNEIVKRVKEMHDVPCRPVIHPCLRDMPRSLADLMSRCWADNAADRPIFSYIMSYVKQKIDGVKQNIVEVMLQRMEKYASNLEDLVEQRTQQLVDEKRKADTLLYRLLPESCANKLKRGEQLPPEMYESATIFCSDIVGFTSISGQSSPMQIVDLLNDLYTHFDEVIATYDAYKVETVGDAYLVVSGIPKRIGDKHAAMIANMSLDILSGLAGFTIQHLPQQRLLVRIGIHTGPCCAGVVGLSMPKYCLFGDTVNIASRMESRGEKQKIHISESAHQALLKLGGYRMRFRKEMEIQDKGLMKTFWLDGKEDVMEMVQSMAAMPEVVE